MHIYIYTYIHIWLYIKIFRFKGCLKLKGVPSSGCIAHSLATVGQRVGQHVRCVPGPASGQSLWNITRLRA